MEREIRYARSTGDIDIAYTVLGDGPVDLVYVSGFITHLDLVWDFPHFSWLESLDGIARVITFDKRGTGLSDRSLGFGSLEERADDIRAVMDAAGSQSAFLYGVSEGGPMSILYAASRPQAVRGLILYGSAARFSHTPDHPFGPVPEVGRQFVDFVGSRWGTGEVFSAFVSDPPDPEATRRLIARFERNACTPQMAAEIIERNLEIDVRSTLSAVSAPTLVLHATGDPMVPVGAARHLAEHIPGARLREFAGVFHGTWRPDANSEISSAAIEFIAGGGAPVPSPERILATVLFTDITASTETASRLGDRSWRSVMDRHDRLCAQTVGRYGGRLVKSTGDGVLATFEGPAKGLACAETLRDELAGLGVRIRSGVHTGEIELRGGDVAGIGVVIARRICDIASAGEVLASRTVRDLVTGSRISFTDRGTHLLKGVPEDWQLYALAQPA